MCIEYYKFESLLKSRGVCLYEFIEEETDYLYYSRNSLHHDFFFVYSFNLRIHVYTRKKIFHYEIFFLKFVTMYRICTKYISNSHYIKCGLTLDDVVSGNKSSKVKV